VRPPPSRLLSRSRHTAVSLTLAAQAAFGAGIWTGIPTAANAVHQVVACSEKLMPTNLDVRETRGFVYLKLGDPVVASRGYDAALPVDPNRSLAL